MLAEANPVTGGLVFHGWTSGIGARRRKVAGQVRGNGPAAGDAGSAFLLLLFVIGRGAGRNRCGWRARPGAADRGL